MVHSSSLLFFLSAVAPLSSINAFVQPIPPIGLGDIAARASPLALHMSKKTEETDAPSLHSLLAGTFIEFQEKNRVHIGKIETVEQNISKVRYQVIDNEGLKYSIPDKQVLYSIPCPNSPGQATKLFDSFSRAQGAPAEFFHDELDVTSELIEMAWEEAAEDELSDHILTADSFIQLIHSHTADAMEKYLAWKLLKTDESHVFFKEIKDHGRVVAFKAKTRKAVAAAKVGFCRTHGDSELCVV